MKKYSSNTHDRHSDDVHVKIDQLLKFLSETTSEDKLLDYFDPKILETKALLEKDSFSNDPLLFQQFIPHIETVDDYTAVKKELLAIKETLQGNPVEARIDKELRELDGQLPKVKSMQQLKEDQALNSKINQLESNSPQCSAGHPMVVRNGGEHGYFWGCMDFPDCYSKRPLRKVELDYLLNDSAPLPPKREQTEKNISNENTTGVQQPLFNLLKELRTDFAKKEKIPPYCIFTDRTLKEMATTNPASVDDLLSLHGMGHKKLEKYGQPFFDVLMKFHSEQSDGTGQEPSTDFHVPEDVNAEVTVLQHQENHDSPESPRQNPHRKADSEDPIEKSITGLIMGFKLEEKTPLDAMMFINDLQKRIRLGSC